MFLGSIGAKLAGPASGLPRWLLALGVLLVGGEAHASYGTLHFGFSAGLAAAGYGGAALFSDSRGVRLGIGAVTASTAGIGKELYDLGTRGDPSGRDLAFDAMGVAAGLLVAWVVDWLLSPGAPAVIPGERTGARPGPGAAALSGCGPPEPLPSEVRLLSSARPLRLELASSWPGGASRW